MIRKATLDDFEYVYPLFSGFRAPRPSKEEFRQLFVRRWDSDEPYVGFVLEEDNEAIGYLGTLFSHREINGRKEKFCNLYTWIIREEYRSEGLPLLFEVLRMKDVTVTNFTGNRVASLLTKFDFKILDPTIKILLPLPLLRDDCKLIFDHASLASLLDDADRKVFEDHRQLRVFFAALKTNDGVSLISFQKTRRKYLPLLEVYSVSHRDVFLNHIRHILPALCFRAGAVGLMIGEHFLGKTPIPFSVSIPQRQLRLFRSKTVSAEEMDTMYSELQVLGL